MKCKKTVKRARHSFPETNVKFSNCSTNRSNGPEDISFSVMSATHLSIRLSGAQELCSKRYFQINSTIQYNTSSFRLLCHAVTSLPVQPLLLLSLLSQVTAPEWLDTAICYCCPPLASPTVMNEVCSTLQRHTTDKKRSRWTPVMRSSLGVRRWSVPSPPGLTVGSSFSSYVIPGYTTPGHCEPVTWTTSGNPRLITPPPRPSICASEDV